MILTAGLPWVVFDPLAELDGRLRHLEAMATDPSFPPIIREGLGALDIKPGLSSDSLWALLGQDDYAANFDFVRQHEQLFSWDLLRLQSSWLVKTLIVGIYAAVALAAGLLLLLTRNRGGLPSELVPVSMFFFATLLLLGLVAAPTLDTFGHVGARGPSWLDALSGAQATAAPRALLPLALLVLLAAVALIRALIPVATALNWDDV